MFTEVTWGYPYYPFLLHNSHPVGHQNLLVWFLNLSWLYDILCIITSASRLVTFQINMYTIAKQTFAECSHRSMSIASLKSLVLPLLLESSEISLVWFPKLSSDQALPISLPPFLGLYILGTLVFSLFLKQVTPFKPQRLHIYSSLYRKFFTLPS